MTKFDPNYLFGARLIQICFGPYQVILNFEENIQISITSEFILTNKNGDIFKFDYKYIDGYIYASLLSTCIDQAIDSSVFLNTDLSSLEITFNNDVKILLNKGSLTESFEIKAPQGIFIF